MQMRGLDGFELQVEGREPFTEVYKADWQVLEEAGIKLLHGPKGS